MNTTGNRKAVCTDKESFAVLLAHNRMFRAKKMNTAAVETMIIRGISDMAGDNKRDETTERKEAMQNAGKFFALVADACLELWQRNRV